jgi:hypothetical protein
VIFLLHQFPPRLGPPPCNSQLVIFIMYAPSCDVPLVHGSPAHACPRPWCLGLFFVPVPFELAEVLSLDGHTQLEIYEAEEAEAVTDAGDDDDHS